MRTVQHTLYSANPYKLMAREYLIKFHKSHSDKIIVFSNNLFALEKMGIMLKRHMIQGDTLHDERLEVLDMFRKALGGFTIFLSKVGDTSLDLLEASVVKEISSQGTSTRQEAQCLGRVLHPKITLALFAVLRSYTDNKITHNIIKDQVSNDMLQRLVPFRLGV